MGRFLNGDNQISSLGCISRNNLYTYSSNSPVMRVDASGQKDYIYTSADSSPTIENDWGFFDFLNPDRYYVVMDGVKYRANSIETVTLTNWSSIDLDFTSTTIDNLFAKADETLYSFMRVWEESVGGEIDFKKQLDETKLYYDPQNEVLYNRNEAGNYAWAFYLTLHGNDTLQGILAQGGTIVASHRLDESWDYQARCNGVKAAYERMDRWWEFCLKYYGLGYPMF